MTSESNWYSSHQSFDEEFNYLPFFVNDNGFRFALETHEGDLITSEEEGLAYYEQHGLPYVRPGGSLRESKCGTNEPTRTNNEPMEGHSSTINIDSGTGKHQK